ncbi:SET domain-containing protein 9 [Linnemannia hyalina]|uniref:SET domain-containing protein 9 n=1 Tax=Linnemannia hyalina TaxID=64524 RepID=A0A9P7Y1R7_9FUNG|nr:SET domain-containing protein 9 [Linnemannia hyalina]
MRDFIHRLYPYQAFKLMLQRVQRQHQRLPSATAATTTTTHSPLSNSSSTHPPPPPPPPPFNPIQARSHLVSYFTALKQAATAAASPSSTQSLPATRTQLTQSHLGFNLSIRPSQIPNSGLGVFLHRHDHHPTSTSTSTKPPTIPTGTIVALYPGTLYHPGEAIFFNSLQNRYILKCEDGIFVDGKPTGLSGSIFRSANGRDNFPGCVPTADITWMVNWSKLWSSTLLPSASSSSSSSPSPSRSSVPSDKTTVTSDNNNNNREELQGIDTSTLLKNPLAVGQIVNNGTAQYPPNVRYQELDIQTRSFPLDLQEFLPNIWYSGDWHSYDHDYELEDNGGDPCSRDMERITGSGGLDRLRTVVLVTTRPIEKDEELYSTYIE